MSCKKDKNKVVENDAVVNEASVCDATQESMSAEECCEKEISDLDKMAVELAACHDKYVRLAAEFDNFRKRTLKEKMDLIEYSGEDVIKSVLLVVDDMDRAVTANEKSDNIDAIKEGMILIKHKMAEILKSKGVTEILALGEKLDTDLHDAIAKFPASEETKRGCVVDVLEKGYRLKDKVIRFSKVVVGE